MGRHARNTDRDADILIRLKKKETLKSIAAFYNMTKQRVAQVGREYGHKYTKISDIAICVVCGKSFPRNAVKIGLNRKHCSRKCVAAKLRKPEGRYSRYGFTKLICAGCKKEI